MQIIALWPLMICDVDAKANCCQMFSDSVLWTAVTDVSGMDNRRQHHGRADQDQNVVAKQSSCKASLGGKSTPVTKFPRPSSNCLAAADLREHDDALPYGCLAFG